jgi:hypothetical protein
METGKISPGEFQLIEEIRNINSRIDYIQYVIHRLDLVTNDVMETRKHVDMFIDRCNDDDIIKQSTRALNGMWYMFLLTTTASFASLTLQIVNTYSK